ncbi:MAG: hypothetical protein ABI947_16275 [Chloroflexota bacterium]
MRNTKWFWRSLIIVLIVAGVGELLPRLWLRNKIDFYADIAPDIRAATYSFAPNDYGVFTLKDSRSQALNISNGMRHTTGQPLYARRKIIMFGNSALFGSHLRDSETVASYLQALLPDWYVENHGFPADQVQQEYARLVHTTIAPDDIVIFYDGSTQALSGYYRLFICDNPRLSILRLLCAPDQGWIANPDTPVVLPEAIRMARQYTQDHRATFLHVFQPLIWSRPLTNSEADMMRRWIDARVIDFVMPPIPSVWQKARAADPDELDLTHVLDEARGGGCTCYIDYIHTSREANSIIAQAIANKIVTLVIEF